MTRNVWPDYGNPGNPSIDPYGGLSPDEEREMEKRCAVGLEYITGDITKEAMLETSGSVYETAAVLRRWAREDGLLPQWTDAEAVEHIRALLG